MKAVTLDFSKLKIDQKYHGKVFKKDGTPIPEDEWIVFRAKDLCFIPALDTYIDECAARGCTDKHLKGLVELRKKVLEFQRDNPERCKIPD